MKRITIEISNHEADVLQALVSMKGSTLDCARTALVDGLSKNLEWSTRVKENSDEFNQVLKRIKDTEKAIIKDKKALSDEYTYIPF